MNPSPIYKAVGTILKEELAGVQADFERLRADLDVTQEVNARTAGIVEDIAGREARLWEFEKTVQERLEREITKQVATELSGLENKLATVRRELSGTRTALDASYNASLGFIHRECYVYAEKMVELSKEMEGKVAEIDGFIVDQCKSVRTRVAEEQGGESLGELIALVAKQSAQPVWPRKDLARIEKEAMRKLELLKVRVGKRVKAGESLLEVADFVSGVGSLGNVAEPAMAAAAMVVRTGGERLGADMAALASSIREPAERGLAVARLLQKRMKAWSLALKISVDKKALHIFLKTELYGTSGRGPLIARMREDVKKRLMNNEKIHNRLAREAA